MHMGFTMRQECIAAVQAKVLRLNSAAISSVTTGKVRCPPASFYPCLTVHFVRNAGHAVAFVMPASGAVGSICWLSLT